MALNVQIDYEAIFDESPVATTIVGTDRRILYVNRAFLDLAAEMEIHIQKEDRVDQDVLDFARSDQVTMWKRIYADLFERGISYHDIDYTARRRDGSLIILELDARPLRAPDGRIVGAIVTRQDVTTERQLMRQREAVARVRDVVLDMEHSLDMEKVLAQVGEELEGLGILFHNCSIQVVDQKQDTFVCYFYRERAVSLSLSRLPLKGSAVWTSWYNKQIVYRRDLEKEDPYHEQEAIRKAAKGPVRCVVDVPFSRGTVAMNSLQPDGFSEQEIQALEDLAGIMSEAFTRYEDFRRLEQEIADRARLEALIKTAGAAAHEINQPLTVILGYAQLMLMQKEAPTNRRALKAICSSAERISEIIQRLQNIQQYRTKPYVGDLEIVDLKEASKASG